jgi:hypothetical protein
VASGPSRHDAQVWPTDACRDREAGKLTFRFISYMRRTSATCEMHDAEFAYYARDVRTGDGLNGPCWPPVEVPA